MQDDQQMVADSYPNDNDSNGPSKPAVSRGARACMMKCVGAEEDGKKPCQRCRRSNVECVFEKHRRGRKPGSKISEQSKMLRKLEKGGGGQKSAAGPSGSAPMIKRDDLPPAQIPYPVSDSRSAPPPDPYNPRYSPREPIFVPSQGQNVNPFPTLTSPYTPHPPRPFPPPHPPPPALPPLSLRPVTAPVAPPGPSTASPRSHSAPMDQDEPAADSDSDSEGDSNDNEVTHLYPAAMVERENRKHSFFNTVLTNPPDASKPQGTHSRTSSSGTRILNGEHFQAAAQQYAPRYAKAGSLFIPIPRHFPIELPPLQDPVDEGIVTLPESQILFDNFFKWLNPFVNLLDPALHQPKYVREKCPFLFTMITMAGCKFWRQDKYRRVQRLAEQYSMRAFVESWNWKTVEVVQAYMCMTYWKEPDDSRTWTFIGCAGRLAIELGLNTWSSEPPVGETEQQRLERRNRERTFLVLWVHDRSLSMQTGRQWMLPEDDLIRNADSWYKGSEHLPVDIVVSAQVSLRRTAAEVTDLFYLHKGGKAPADVNYDVLLRSANHRLQQWADTWNEVLRGGMYSFLSYPLLFPHFFSLQHNANNYLSPKAPPKHSTTPSSNSSNCTCDYS
ncbi:hypothetical protein M422DRAFT_261875 [Sphaerobolus stellatus SS14]|uniref:Xylanolytic transcriptional activator regulatory domain-containing protein n=1 Tax=Sphaerobolus stellatus (strain SS14) TaxID=990650 RepID=A0A0C9VDM0_SPHS4|nr:hypothetical protein M422DRAFT_261875 [Sphaerobolus stellatus SS14]